MITRKFRHDRAAARPTYDRAPRGSAGQSTRRLRVQGAESTCAATPQTMSARPLRAHRGAAETSRRSSPTRTQSSAPRCSYGATTQALRRRPGRRALRRGATRAAQVVVRGAAERLRVMTRHRRHHRKGSVHFRRDVWRGGGMAFVLDADDSFAPWSIPTGGLAARRDALGIRAMGISSPRRPGDAIALRRADLLDWGRKLQRFWQVVPKGCCAPGSIRCGRGRRQRATERMAS